MNTKYKDMAAMFIIYAIFCVYGIYKEKYEKKN